MRNLLLAFAVITAINVNGQGFILGAKAGLTNTQIIGADFKSFQIPTSSNGFFFIYIYRLIFTINLNYFLFTITK